MRLIRLDGWGPDGSDLLLDPRLTVVLGAPPGLVGALVRAVRALRDPSVPPPAGLLELDGSTRAIGAVAPDAAVDPVLDLRGSSRSAPVVTTADDPGAASRRRTSQRIDELRRELAGLDATLSASRALTFGPTTIPDGLDTARRLELEGAADELALVLLNPHAEDPDQFCELERRLRGVLHAADEAAIRVEATTWRIDELRRELTNSGGSVEAAAERSVLVAELEAVRSDLVELDRRGSVASGDRERLAALRARAAVLLDELGYDDYVSYLLDELAGAPSRRGRRERVTEARRGLLSDELARLRASLPDELDAQAAGLERSRLQAEAAALLGIDVAAVRRLTVTEVADVLRARSAARDPDALADAASQPGDELAAAVGRLVRALGALGAEPAAGSGDPVELLAAARQLLAGWRGAATPPEDRPDLRELETRRAVLAAELAEQERLLGVLLGAVERDPGGPEAVGPDATDLPVGVPLVVRGIDSGRIVADPTAVDGVVQGLPAEVEERLAALRQGLAGGAGPLPIVVLVDPDPPASLANRLTALIDGLQCVVVGAAASSTWRAIGEDAGRVVEW